mmetsp:Transcript_82212/g.164323  ORF Transcript_82212/g.164323 Transcript_82212/m.164323 type:complete len:101 (-) Transcript_82212:983-1285(-)
MPTRRLGPQTAPFSVRLGTSSIIMVAAVIPNTVAPLVSCGDEGIKSRKHMIEASAQLVCRHSTHVKPLLIWGLFLRRSALVVHASGCVLNKRRRSDNEEI